MVSVKAGRKRKKGGRVNGTGAKLDKRGRTIPLR